MPLDIPVNHVFELRLGHANMALAASLQLSSFPWKMEDSVVAFLPAPLIIFQSSIAYRTTPPPTLYSPLATAISQQQSLSNVTPLLGERTVP